MLSPLAGQRRPAARLQMEVGCGGQEVAPEVQEPRPSLSPPRPRPPERLLSPVLLTRPHQTPQEAQEPSRAHRHLLLSQPSPPSTLLEPLDSHGPISAKGPFTCQLSSPLGHCWPEPFLVRPVTPLVLQGLRRAALTPHTPPSHPSPSHLNTQR